MNRILTIRDIETAAKELKKINVSSGGIESMAPKMDSTCIKLENVRLPAANILKQEMLSLGGDAAVARGVVNGENLVSDVILIGNSMKLKRLTGKLNYQKYFGLPDIKQDILRLLKNRSGELFSKLEINGRKLELNRTQIMGILNVTPDSFSDGNRYGSSTEAVNEALDMVKIGAAVIDVGGESTRPGAVRVSEEEELKRVIPVIEGIRAKSNVFISIDTRKAKIAAAAVKAGADIINDISALRHDHEMITVIRENPCVHLVLMHMQGTPENMQNAPYYKDTMREITDFLSERISVCEEAGIERNRLFIDPGIGFGKRHEDNLIILQRLEELHCLDCKVVLGASRKSFIGRIDGSSAEEREGGSLAATSLACRSGIHLVRVHEVKKNAQLLATLTAIKEQR